MRNMSVRKMTTVAILIAVGVVIPLFSPLKIVIEPASFTLASHVTIFMAMFISPFAAVAVSVGTTFGFLMGGFPLVVVLRAASHVVFVFIGSVFLKNNNDVLTSPVKRRIYSLIIGIIHALVETIIVTIFYFGANMTESYYKSGFFYAVIILVGVGGLIHSMVDFEIAYYVTKALCVQSDAKLLFGNFKINKKSNSIKTN